MNGFYSLVGILIFLIILALVTQRSQIVVFFTTRGGKLKVKKVSDKSLTTLIRNKAKFELEIFQIAKSDKPYGMMVGLPNHPIMVISSKAYEDFNQDEIEYLVLHEAGHYALKHSFREALFSIILFLSGMVIILLSTNPWITFLLSFFLGVVFGIINIQLAKISEFEADRFALQRISRPSGMITATEKFENAWKDIHIKNKFAGFLFDRAVPYKKRISMANEEIEKRRVDLLQNR